MVCRGALTDDDISGDSGLTTEDFNTKALAVRIAAVLYTTFTFFVSHILEY
jgi:hypothetical protein